MVAIYCEGHSAGHFNRRRAKSNPALYIRFLAKHVIARNPKTKRKEGPLSLGTRTDCQYLLHDAGGLDLVDFCSLDCHFQHHADFH